MVIVTAISFVIDASPNSLLPALDERFKQAYAQVKGCESQAWLYHKLIDGKHYFCADSDARIVKALIAILLAATTQANALMQFAAR